MKLKSINVQLQAEAQLLRDIEDTKVVALGIGDDYSVTELNGVATDPDEENVIEIEDYSQIDAIEEQLIDRSCAGW